MKEHPKLSRAGILLLVAGFALGRLVDVGRRRRPEGPRAEAVSAGQEAPPVTGSAPYSQDEPRRKWTAIASNPLVVALISAAVARIVSFLVAGYQNQVARSQAVSAQPTQEVVQMEQSAGATFEDLQSVATYALKCSLQGGRWDNCFFKEPDFDKYLADSDIADATIDNVTDQWADSLALRFQQKATASVPDKDVKSGLKDWADSVKAELDLVQRCGLITQGFQ